MLKRLSGIDFAPYVLTSFLAKGFVTSFSYPDVAVCALLISAAGFRAYLSAKAPKKIEIDAEIRAELDTIRSAVTAIRMERGLSQAQPSRQKHF